MHHFSAEQQNSRTAEQQKLIACALSFNSFDVHLSKLLLWPFYVLWIRFKDKHLGQFLILKASDRMRQEYFLK